MAARGQIPPTFERRPIQIPGVMRQGPSLGLGTVAGQRLLESLPPSELLENKIAGQAAEMDRLAGENSRLAATHSTMRQELVAVQQEVRRTNDHIRSIQREHDIQNTLLPDKIRKLQADIKAGECMKKDLQKAHMEAQSLVAARQELNAKVQKAIQELQKARVDVHTVRDLHAELDILRQEHQRLRAIFEYEKGVNIEQVEQLQAMEKNLIGMAREVEKLRAESRTFAPGGSHVNPDVLYPSAIQGGAYIDSYGRPLLQLGSRPAGEVMIRYSSCNPGGADVDGTVPSAGSGAVPGGVYDPSLAER